MKSEVISLSTSKGEIFFREMFLKFIVTRTSTPEFLNSEFLKDSRIFLLIRFRLQALPNRLGMAIPNLVEACSSIDLT